MNDKECEGCGCMEPVLARGIITNRWLCESCHANEFEKHEKAGITIWNAHHRLCHYCQQPVEGSGYKWQDLAGVKFRLCKACNDKTFAAKRAYKP